jgi:hypothetical protein
MYTFLMLPGSEKANWASCTGTIIAEATTVPPSPPLLSLVFDIGAVLFWLPESSTTVGMAVGEEVEPQADSSKTMEAMDMVNIALRLRDRRALSLRSPEEHWDFAARNKSVFILPYLQLSVGF